MTNPNLPLTGQKRIVIAGGGFAGLKLARLLIKKDYQVILLDKNNYHQFQPLLYQVATAGLEPNAIAFPFRKIFQRSRNLFLRVCEFKGVNLPDKQVLTDIGPVSYDFLVIALGVDTNYFGNKNLATYTLPMKSVAEALGLRNRLLLNYEKALITTNPNEKEGLMNIVVVGGGPTGVEISGTLAEMRKTVFPKDFPELHFKEMKLFLLEASDNLLNGMSQKASEKSMHFLQKKGVIVKTASMVSDFDGKQLSLADGSTIRSNTVIWAAGVSGKRFPGLPDSAWGKGNRIIVDAYNRVNGLEHVFVLGDLSLQAEEKYPSGHPQLAQVGIQQAKLLSRNLSMADVKYWKPFHYVNLGSLATVGRNMAIAEFPAFRFYGFIAWLTWLFVHLVAIVGVKNRIFIFLTWIWAYFTYDQSLRLILKNEEKK